MRSLDHHGVNSYNRILAGNLHHDAVDISGFIFLSRQFENKELIQKLIIDILTTTKTINTIMNPAPKEIIVAKAHSGNLSLTAVSSASLVGSGLLALTSVDVIFLILKPFNVPFLLVSIKIVSSFSPSALLSPFSQTMKSHTTLPLLNPII